MPALVLFALGLALRLLFRHATPDGGATWHAGFQGDAPVWQEFAASSARHALTDAMRLPMRPPAMQWLSALLWDGAADTAGTIRLLFVALGAAVAPLLWLVLRRHTTPAVAFTTAALCAVAGNLLLLSSGLHVETLYLALVLVALWLQPRLHERPPLPAVAWGVLQGGLCLVRAEHALTTLVWLALARAAGATWRNLAFAVVAAAGALAPWQWHANALVDAFNRGAPTLPAVSLPWDAEAVTALRALPAFHQVPTYRFVTDTVRVRGGTQVRAADLETVREAFGVMPAALPHGFVAFYGPLNFFLGNTPEADGGFSTLGMNRPAPLTGGDQRYPRGLRQNLPGAGKIAFEYPPHADLIANGTRRGLQELAAAPLAAAGRIATKLWHAAEGATGGIGGHAVPIGLSGVRRQVDLVTATGLWPNAWRIAVLGAAAIGLWSLRRERALWPLFAFAATKLLVVAAVFGYARQGALCLPVVALGVAACAARWVPPRRWLAPVLLGAVLALEIVRGVVGADVHADGGAANAPLPASDFQPRRLEFR